ncbi:WXG100 family type VII secretion target [Streptomyces kronopolitis]|uniref:WXG100 family type VII secretion target n=1 Tax=Streptomyces kronopolitis TaxID=1612435 RepID=UPI0020BF4374|nr:hypothetical protein [Streptomyces kronopolitis]MCL6296931.1 hypothetical protein [Streptomyces kronopolitis]
MKAMVRDAQPAKVEEIADHWMHVHDQLAGDAPDGSVRDLLDKAVADVLEYWHGSAAEAFATRARMLSTSLKNGSLYAKNTSHTLKSAAIDLREAKRAVTALQDTTSESRSGNFLGAAVSLAKDGWDKVEDGFSGRDDSGLNRDISKGMSAAKARAAHADTLSRGREIALQAAAHMEKLGASYNVKANQLAGTPITEKNKPVPAPDTLVPPPIVSAGGAPTAARPRKTGSNSSGGRTARGGAARPGGGVNSPRTAKAGGPGPGTGTSGGRARQTMPKAPLPGTALDGVRGGVPTPVDPSVTGSGGPVVGGTTPGHPGSGPGAAGVPPGGQPVVGGRGSNAGRVTRPGMPGVPATPPGGRTAAKGAAAPGTPGQPGQTGRPPLGGATGPGASGKAGIRGRQGGGQARRPGGVVGEPAEPGTPGRGAQGGSGLHRSRGGALNASQEGTSRGRGPMGVPPGGRPARDGKERRRSARPDYLVEDEETWVSRRDIVPGVVGLSGPEGAGDAEATGQANRHTEQGSSEGSGGA